MNSFIFGIFLGLAVLNAGSFLVGFIEWLWFTVIMQEKSPGFFWKWQNFKYSWLVIEIDEDSKDPVTILLDIGVLFVGGFVFAMLGSMGLLFPLVVIVGLVWGARIYVASGKAKADSAS